MATTRGIILDMRHHVMRAERDPSVVQAVTDVVLRVAICVRPTEFRPDDSDAARGSLFASRLLLLVAFRFYFSAIATRSWSRAASSDCVSGGVDEAARRSRRAGIG